MTHRVRGRSLALGLLAAPLAAEAQQAAKIDRIVLFASNWKLRLGFVGYVLLATWVIGPCQH
ncbi:MAG: hypothetical protein L0191_05300 [Acidobacteria bacterium]|nr:hypothetical protein [Acidobacteriota bacterium]